MQKDKEKSPFFYLAWANLQSMETHFHSRRWHACTEQVQCKIQETMLFRLSLKLVSLSEKTDKQQHLCRQKEGQHKMERSNPEDTLKLLNPQQLALFFLDPN